MLIKSLKLKNYKQYKGEHIFTFDNFNIIEGNIGVGKSNLISAIPFVLFGYSTTNIDRLATQGTESGYIEIILAYNSDIYKIRRHFPTQLQIWLNGEEVKIKDKNDYLKQRFGDILNFKKLRSIDAKDSSINFLEQGQTSLKKYLIDFNQSSLNNIRNRLLSTKNEREKYSIEAVIYKHYPSEKRLEILEKGLEKNKELIETLRDTISPLRKRIENNKRIVSLDKYELNRLASKLDYLKKGICHECNQKLPNIDPTQIEVDIETLKIKILNNESDLVNDQEYLQNFESEIEETMNHQTKTYNYISKLKGRLQQSQYKYTQADVLEIKDSINVLDQFYSFYLKETLSSLEPLINQIIQKIGYTLKFSINNKNDLEFLLISENKQFRYDEMSTGQKLLISIAFKLALLLKNNYTGLIIADEGVASLDAQALSYILQLFQGLPFQLICVIHRLDNIPEGIKSINLNKYFNLTNS